MTHALRLLVSVGITLSSAIPAGGPVAHQSYQGDSADGRWPRRPQCAAAARGRRSSRSPWDLGMAARTVSPFIAQDLKPEEIPSFMGYSVGRWEGDDTLVVETIGYKDRTWLDFAGTPHSEKLRITERVRRPDFGHLEIVETIDDPVVFARPFTVTMGAQFSPDTELLEFVCAENERNRSHFSGTMSELMKENLSRAVTIAPAILEKYAGTYDFRYPETPTTPQYVQLRMQNGQLTMGGPPLIALSETRFSSGFGVFDVIRDEHGVATQLVMRVAEGEIRATRVTSK